MAQIKIYRNKQGKFWFSLNPDNHVVLISEPFISRTKCLDKIHYLKQHSRVPESYTKLKASCGSYYFQFKNHITGELIGTSESYLDKRSMENAMSLMKLAVNTITIDDEVYVL